MADKEKPKGKPGSGERFKALTDKLEGEGHDEDSAKAIAASIGRKKYGAKKMAAWAAAHRAGKT